jgi:ABC-type sulfate transport system permease subunit
MPATALSVIAISQSSAAMAIARQQEEKDCKVFLDGFQPAIATIEQKKEYAKCVNMIYPSPMSSADILFFKIALVIAFIGMAIGMWREAKYEYSDKIMVLLMGGLGFFIAPIAVGFIGALIYGALWLVGIV